MARKPVGADTVTGELPVVVESRIQALIAAVTDLLVPKTTTINGEALDADVVLDGSDLLVGVGTLPDIGQSSFLIPDAFYISFSVLDSLPLKADIDSPEFTGNPQAPTPAAGDNDTSIATTQFVTRDAILKALVTAKGDLIVATASGVVARLAVGANGTRLVANSAVSTGQSWEAPTSTTAALAAIGNAINTAGKYAGKMLFNTTTSKPVWAVGSTAGSVWVDGTGATVHTPV